MRRVIQTYRLFLPRTQFTTQLAFCSQTQVYEKLTCLYGSRSCIVISETKVWFCYDFSRSSLQRCPVMRRISFSIVRPRGCRGRFGIFIIQGPFAGVLCPFQHLQCGKKRQRVALPFQKGGGGLSVGEHWVPQSGSGLVNLKNSFGAILNTVFLLRHTFMNLKIPILCIRNCDISLAILFQSRHARMLTAGTQMGLFG